MTKIHSKLLCGFLVLLSASFTSVCSWAEQTKFLSPRITTKITQQSSVSALQTSAPINNSINSSDLGFEFAHQLLSTQNKSLPTQNNHTDLSNLQRQGVTVSVATLMKPTNLPGRYLGNSKVTLVHY